MEGEGHIWNTKWGGIKSEGTHTWTRERMKLIKRWKELPRGKKKQLIFGRPTEGGWEVTGDGVDGSWKRE